MGASTLSLELKYYSHKTKEEAKYENPTYR